MIIRNLYLRDRIITAEELNSEVLLRISYLQIKKIPRQGKVIIPMTANIGTIAWLYACFFSGRIACPIAADTTNDELRDLVQILQPQLVLTACSEAAPTTAKAKIEPTRPEEIMAILLSSGSTGQPKAVALSGANFIASAEAHGQHNKEVPENIWLACLPLFHIGGLSIFTRALILGQEVAWLPNFQEKEFLQFLASNQQKISGVSLVPTILYRLLRADIDLTGLQKLKMILLGGAGADAELLILAKEKNINVAATYGLTEACSQVITNGRPLPGFHLRLDPDGELWIKGPSVCLGYLSGGKKVQKIVNKDGYFSTQDIAAQSETGDWKILGRKSELIISGGENVFPAEIENALASLPGISDCAACALPDSEWGQKLALAYVLSGTNKLEPEQIRDYLKKKLSPWKVPKVYKEIDEVPRTKNKKIIRQKVENFFI